MSTQKSINETTMVTAVSLVPGDVVIFGNETAVIEENRENIAWKGLRYISYHYESMPHVGAGGTYRPDEMMEKVK